MTALVRTEHPHIVKNPGIRGGEPIVAGTRIGVAQIARFLLQGVNPQQILDTYPHLTPAAVHDAISYYYDHKGEIDRIIEEAKPEAVAKRVGFTVRERGRATFKQR